ncbi:MAG: LiaI-LiaF-like domain-containing protein [Candidatus Limnocylindrales bacterium]
MRIWRRALGWGVFFIVVGIVALGARLGWFDVRFISDIGRLWPLILVAIGVGLILERTSLGPLGNIVVGATFGLLVGGVLANGPGIGLGCVDLNGQPGSEPAQVGSFTSESASVRLHLACGELDVSTASGTGWQVGGASERIAVGFGSSTLYVSPSSGGFVFPTGRAADLVTVQLPTGPITDLDLTLDAGRLEADLANARLSGLSGTINAGDGRIDLSSTQVDSLSLTLNAGDLDVLLPTTASQASVTVNAGQLHVCAPAGVGLRVTSTTVLGATTYGPGFSQEGGAWLSSAWASASQRIELRMTINVGAANVVSGGCE